MAEDGLPLAGITVVELGHSVAAPFAGQILADLGARVVKVEKPGTGDDARVWGPPFWEGASATFQSLNRNKLSVTVDLKDEAELARLRAFILGEADVVVQNMRPGLVERLGLDAAALTGEKPALVYCNLGAFGDRGPLAGRPGYDPLMQAFGGIMSITGEEGRAPVRAGPSIVDLGAGMWSVIGILAALRKREAGGRGGRVDTSLFETALAWMTVPVALTLAGEEPGRNGSEAAMLVPYKAYKAADKYIVVTAGNQNLYRRLCTVLERPQWIDDPRFATNAERVRNRALLNGMIEGVLSGAPAATWAEKLDRAGVPCALIQSTAEAIAHPQTEAVGMIQPMPEGAMRLVGMPLRFDGARLPVRNGPPALGADTHTIFAKAQAE